MDSKDLKKFSYINCICCGFKISTSDSPNLSEDNIPEHKIWNDGVVSVISCGYGSSHDGDIYYIGICDTCIGKNDANGRMRYVNDYLYGSPIKYTPEELNDIEKKRNRENNLNDLGI